ncbi:MAG: nucleotidyltransferase domain-containing protein [Myxococcales bacterium]|nr:nucleotidyltransferase domain-containing protein [Myxococcales bacterium]
MGPDPRATLLRSGPPWLAERTLFLTRHGSHAYGLATAESDVDVRGFAVPPKAYYLGFHQRFEQAEQAEPDTVVYELRKFVRLAADANPSVLELLFTAPEDHLWVDPVAAQVLAARERFLSKKVRHTFSGFAMAQLKRLEASRRFIVSPPRDPSDGDWAAFTHWRTHRNPRRAALEAAHGYDTKFGAHIVRLLRMAREILTEGVVKVRRPDADELRGIREGAWSFERLAAFAAEADDALSSVSAASPLAHHPNMVELDACCVEWVDAALGCATSLEPRGGI